MPIKQRDTIRVYFEADENATIKMCADLDTCGQIYKRIDNGPIAYHIEAIGPFTGKDNVYFMVESTTDQIVLLTVFSHIELNTER